MLPYRAVGLARARTCRTGERRVAQELPLAAGRFRDGHRAAGCRLCSAHVDSPGRNMQLATDGFALVRSLLSETECDEVARSLAAADLRGAGSRRLLREAWCAALAAKVMAHPDVREA